MHLYVTLLWSKYDWRGSRPLRYFHFSNMAPCGKVKPLLTVSLTSELMVGIVLPPQLWAVGHSI